MESVLAGLAEWLAQTPASLFIQSVTWLVPLVQTVHILAIAVVLSSVGMIVLSVLGLAGAGPPRDNTPVRYLSWIWGGLVVLLTSGAILIVGEPDRTLGNPVFHWKMVLVLMMASATAVFHARVARQAPVWDPAPRPSTAARLVALLAFAVWLTIAVLGRWIAYV